MLIENSVTHFTHILLCTLRSLCHLAGRNPCKICRQLRIYASCRNKTGDSHASERRCLTRELYCRHCNKRQINQTLTGSKLIYDAQYSTVVVKSMIPRYRDIAWESSRNLPFLPSSDHSIALGYKLYFFANLGSHWSPVPI